eukprot:6193787-Pleurochrysis_carterae.AAC.1
MPCVDPTLLTILCETRRHCRLSSQWRSTSSSTSSAWPPMLGVSNKCMFAGGFASKADEDAGELSRCGFFAGSHCGASAGINHEPLSAAVFGTRTLIVPMTSAASDSIDTMRISCSNNLLCPCLVVALTSRFELLRHVVCPSSLSCTVRRWVLTAAFTMHSRRRAELY